MAARDSRRTRRWRGCLRPDQLELAQRPEIERADEEVDDPNRAVFVEDPPSSRYENRTLGDRSWPSTDRPNPLLPVPWREL